VLAGALIPYIKLVQSERLSAPARTEDAYNEFFTSEDFDRLFNESIVDKLAEIQIMTLQKERLHSTEEISKILGLSPGEVQRHLEILARQQNIRTEATDTDRVDQILKKYQGKKNSLVQVLLEIQEENRWLPQDVLESISKKLGVPLSRIMQIVTFHNTFRLIPREDNE
ncbi:MAG: NAD(P)H-dependent oxidoreductase subunit E, partial [Candidatus Aminicenantes bacterium]